MRDRRDFLIAGLVGALLFCVGLLVGQQGPVLPAAYSQGGEENTGFDPEQPVTPGDVLPPIGKGGGGVQIGGGDDPFRSRLNSRTTSTTASDSNSNNRFVAVTCPIGSGESVLFLIDSKSEQLAVYRFLRRKGLEFMAGRKIDYDLKIMGYQDISKLSRGEMKSLYDREVAKAAAKALKGK